MSHDAVTDETKKPPAAADAALRAEHEDGDQVCVVDPESLHRYMPGWVVVGRVRLLVPVVEAEQTVAPIVGGVLHDDHHGIQNSYGQTITLPSHLSPMPVIDMPRRKGALTTYKVRYVEVEHFLLRKSRNSVVSDLTRQIEDLKSKRLSVEARCGEAVALADKTQKDLVTATELVRRLSADHERTAGRLSDREKSLRRVEDHLAKVRAAIGSKAFDDIVDETK